MSDKPYTDADVEQTAAMVRARIGWPISAGEAGTIVTATLDALVAAGWQPPDRAEKTRHILEVRDGGWTVHHPRGCELAEFGCRVSAAAEESAGMPSSVAGRYACWVDSIDGRLRISTDRAEVACCDRLT
ncbi:hypothetical protein [Micromonospora sp. NPDC049891]|uniref:hypothetical protein n=1 Tax=Micromonospora sp. NPDC049891 TaxID=3155655 RepID=UPI0034000B54